MTYLQIVNAVLRRLRETEVAAVTDTAYSKMVGDFVNEAKREVEDAWNWTRLRSTVQVTCVAGTFSYTLTGAGERFRTLQVVNDSQDIEMRMATYRAMNTFFTMSGSVQRDSPIYYGFNGFSGSDPNVDVWPIPDAADILNFNLVIPQDDLSSDATVLTVPSWPVILGAHAKATSERGEDGSTAYAEVMMNYSNALSDAIALDSIQASDELEWVVC